MRHRRLRAGGILAVAGSLISFSVAGQAPVPASPTATAPENPVSPPQPKSAASVALERAMKTRAAKDWKQPRTAWGDPDLEGVWSYATTTPLSRPAQYGDREFLTPEEVAALAAEQDKDEPPRAGDTGTYGSYWFDRGQSIGRTSLIIDPPNGKLPPLTPQAEKDRAARMAYRREHPADSYLDRSPTDRCIMYHGVPPLPSGYNNTYQIFQTPKLVAILDEEIHHVRLIPMDGRPHLTPEIRRWNGDSRGRWEGNTLVVETTNFNDKTDLRYGGSSDTVAIERFTRVGPHLIDYRYTITDPTVYTKPFTVAIPMPKRDDLIYEYACHEGNYAIVNILAGARAEEQAAEKSKAGAAK